MTSKRTSARKRQTKISFSPASKSSPAQTTPPKATRKSSSKKKQSKIDIHNIAPKGTPKRASQRTITWDSSEDELQIEDRSMPAGLPVRAKSNGMFGSSDVASETSTSDSESEMEKPVKAGGTKRRQRADSTDDEGTVTVIQRKRARQDTPEEDTEEEELRLPSKRRRVERREATPKEESEEDIPTPPRSMRRRLIKRPATPEEDEEQTPPRSSRRRARRQQPSSDEEEEEEHDEDTGVNNDDAEEQEELKEELAFLRSSPLPDRGRLRSTHDKPKNKRQEALEALKRRRAGSTQESSSTPARRQRTVLESDSDSDLEVIKEEPDSDAAVDEPQSEIEDDEEEDRDANALDMFQEDEDDTGFIDDDPDAVIGEPDDDQPQLPIEFTSLSRAKPKELFKYAVEWMVMKKIHPAFNSNDEIYELTFRKLGDEVKALASSKFTSSAWTSDFTKAINARPNLLINDIEGARREFLADHCEACNRKNHPATFELSLTGAPYNPESLEPLESNSDSTSDSNSSSSSSSSSLSASSSPNLTAETPTYDFRGDPIPPESKLFTLGSTCKANAQVAHTLHHWRYHLNDWVKGWLESNGYLTPEKLVKRDRKSDQRREKEARRIVDRMERLGEVGRLQRAYREQVRFAVEAVNDFRRGWGRR